MGENLSHDIPTMESLNRSCCWHGDRLSREMIWSVCHGWSMKEQHRVTSVAVNPNIVRQTLPQSVQVKAVVRRIIEAKRSKNNEQAKQRIRQTTIKLTGTISTTTKTKSMVVVASERKTKWRTFAV